MNSKGFIFGLIVLAFLFSFSSCKKENQLPSCTITYPNNGDEFEPGDTIAISVEANDNDGLIAEVNFYIDDIGIFSSNSFPYGYSWNTLDETIGNHTIKVIAKDNEGGSKTDECTISIIGKATVVTIEASSITHNSAIVGGNISDDGSSAVTARGVCWNTFSNPTILDAHTTSGNGIGNFTSSITGLLPATTRYVRAYATNGAGTSYGNEINFTTLFESGTLTDTRDGHTYSTVRIGNQWWMSENLNATKYNDGTPIPLVTYNTAWDNLCTPGYCWYDNDSATYANPYGALYNWYTVETGDLCPTGWHVPSYDEWTTLADNLGGTIAAGGKLKETGTTHWSSPNTGATNESGFTALPGGLRFYNGGTFHYVGNSGDWWSSSKYGSKAYHSGVSYDSNDLGILPCHKSMGISVRCIKDE